MSDITNDPTLRSWVASANAADTDFPVQNLPYGRFRRAGGDEPWRIGVAIGDQVLDLGLAASQCPWGASVLPLLQPLAGGDLRPLMSGGTDARRALRAALSQALREDSEQAPFLELCLLPQAEAEMDLPCHIGGYTDFYTGIHHATAVGTLLRPDQPLLPNYKWVPIGYHGRSSSIRVGGRDFRRPRGQFRVAADGPPEFGPSRRLDYELELGALVGQGNELGCPVAIDDAEGRLFGVCLLNDWSARDIQSWEYQPLGPFLGKSFCTSVSPWIVTMEALEPYRCAWTRAQDDPQPLQYLESRGNRERGAIAITLEAWLETPAMRQHGEPAAMLSQSNFREAYWTLAQLLAHHTSNGCNLETGDLLGSGTQSGPRPGQGGSLLELSQGGRQALTLPNGETRTFLLDGDRVILRAWCQREGGVRIGFGDCAATVLGASEPGARVQP
jgi:fumarylacetoacetase